MLIYIGCVSTIKRDKNHQKTADPYFKNNIHIDNNVPTGIQTHNLSTGKQYHKQLAKLYLIKEVVCEVVCDMSSRRSNS